MGKVYIEEICKREEIEKIYKRGGYFYELFIWRKP